MLRKFLKLPKGLLILLLFAVIGFTFFQSPSKKVESIPIQLNELAPNYLVYSDTSLKQAHQKGRVVLYFWAPWCVTCASLDSELESGKAKIPDGVSILQINYDTASELKKKYNIVTQHTFVEIDKEGKELKKWVGGGVEDFEKYLK